jgi:nucleotide-binding universal stress UspA family protein
MRPFDIRQIVVPTDMAETTLPALRWARLFAERFHSRITILYADPVTFPLDFAGAGLAGATLPRIEAKLRDELIQHVAPVLGGLPYESVVTAGQPIPAILETAREVKAGLIVAGKHRYRGWQRALLGSVSDGVIYGAECPVLIVAADYHGQERAVLEAVVPKSIVCPVNFTTVARESLHAAARLAEVFGAELVVVHVIESEDLAGADGAEARVREWLESEGGCNCSYRELVLRGSAAESVLDAAEDIGAGLIVVGAQHRFFRNATVIGTTADRLIRFASCPVLVVPRAAVASTERAALAAGVTAR